MRFQIYTGRDGQYYWRLVANNHEIICVSEGFTTKQSARDSVAWVKRNASVAPLEEI